MARNLKTVTAFVAERQAFTTGQVRWWIFNESNNGMKQQGVVVRLGRRVYLDLDAFDRWVDSQQAVAV
jgi:hypothetical protein